MVTYKKEYQIIIYFQYSATVIFIHTSFTLTDQHTAASLKLILLKGIYAFLGLFKKKLGAICSTLDISYTWK